MDPVVLFSVAKIQYIFLLCKYFEDFFGIKMPDNGRVVFNYVLILS